jgi:hypothetical protein
MRAAVPVVEVAHQPDALSARRPDGERRAVDLPGQPVVATSVSAEDFPELLVAALADEVQVDLAERGQEAVGVVQTARRPVVGDLEAVVGHVRTGHHTRPDPAVLVLQLVPVIADAHGH